MGLSDEDGPYASRKRWCAFFFFFYSKKGIMQTVPVLYSLPWKASGFTGIQEHHIFPFMTLANGQVQDPFLALSMY
ncbi:hypothetical protein ACE6H2_022906 [Prunus campanulata]